MGLPFELVEDFNTRWYVTREVHIFEKRAACVQIAQLANLMNALIVLTAKEALGREIWNLERKEILAKIDGINEMVGTKDTFGNGMAAAALARQHGWQLTQPNRVRGQYFGLIVALEFHVAIVKISRTELLELPFGSLAVTEEKSPRIGESVRMSFKDGVLTATIKRNWT